jgi:7-carboxy-7-deazaguanine synthase (Cx14CxxC type)
MTYSVKEIFYTLQGEGGNAGRPAVFCRFSGCNLWSGREQDRASAVCQFCDTEFVGTDGTLGGKFDTAEALALKIASLWPNSDKFNRFVVLTGGEPLLQVDEMLLDALHAQGFTIAVESNGTVKAPKGIDWLCISPKAGAAGVDWVQKSGNELKVVWPQIGFTKTDLDNIANSAELNFDTKYISPMDNISNKLLQKDNIKVCIQICLDNPAWKLSLQTHKITGIR